jgi:hypothetical protein
VSTRTCRVALNWHFLIRHACSTAPSQLPLHTAHCSSHSQTHQSHSLSVDIYTRYCSIFYFIQPHCRCHLTAADTFLLHLLPGTKRGETRNAFRAIHDRRAPQRTVFRIQLEGIAERVHCRTATRVPVVHQLDDTQTPSQTLYPPVYHALTACAACHLSTHDRSPTPPSSDRITGLA